MSGPTVWPTSHSVTITAKPPSRLFVFAWCAQRPATVPKHNNSEDIISTSKSHHRVVLARSFPPNLREEAFRALAFAGGDGERPTSGR